MSGQKIMLDLFAGTQSVLKAIDKNEWEYFGIDIAGDKNHKLDFRDPDVLSQIQTLLNNRKPNFIWASPPCNIFSSILVCKGGNFYFEVDKHKNLKPRTNFNIKLHPHLAAMNPKTPAKKQEFYRKIKQTLKIYENLKKVLDHY